MGALVLLLLTFLAAAVPDVAPRALSIASHPPDLFVALAAYLALRGSGYAAVGWAVLLGCAKDAVSLDPLGTHAFVLGTVAFLLARDRGAHAAGREPIRGVARAAAVGGAVVLSGVLYALRAWPIAGSAAPFAAIPAAFPCALWTALFSAPLLFALDRTRALDDLVTRHDALRA